MKRELRIEIDCGDETCASEPGKFCPFLLTSRYGQRFHCRLFCNLDLAGLSYEELKEKKGWLQRHKECLLSEIINVTINHKHDSCPK